MANALTRSGGVAEKSARGAGDLLVNGLVLAVLGAATGAGLGFTLGEIRLPEQVETAQGPQASRYGEGVEFVKLAPIVTNLAEPAEVWVRLDAGLVMEGVPPEETGPLGSAVAGDLLGYLRTLPLAQVQGAAGLAHLREDLAERARMRSDGRVREIVVESLIVQ